MEKKKQVDYSIFVYALFFVVSVWPLMCGYILQGADVYYWVARIEEVYRELAIGGLQMMPSQELLTSFWGEGSGINTNLWLFVPAILRLLGVSMVDAYRLFLGICNLVTVLGAVWFFASLTEKSIVKVTGVGLFVLCPYRVYFCYDNIDFGKVILWMLLPFLAGSLVRLFNNQMNIKSMVVFAASMGGMLYGDVAASVFVAGICFLVILLGKRWKMLIPLVGGVVLFLPFAIPFIRYIIKGIYIENYLPVGSIMKGGYTLGKIFSSYAYEEALPGLSLGVIIALILLLWLLWCDEKKDLTGWFKPVSMLATGCILASMQFFPWDYAMRLGGPFLRLIGLWESPVMFLGFAGSLLAVLGAYTVERALENKEEFISWIMPVAINIATIGVYLYLCWNLMEVRGPIVLA